MSRAMATVQKAIFECLILNTSVRTAFLDIAIPATDIATTSTNNLTFVITDVTRRYLAEEAVVVKVGGSIVTTGFTLTKSTGTIVFNSSQSSAVTLSGKYYPIRIYDEVPKDATFPYLDLGEYDSHADNVYGKIGEECFCTIHVYTGPKLNGSYSQGNKEIQGIGSSVITALDGTPLVLTGYSLTAIQWIEDSIYKEDQIRHMTIKFRLWIRAL